MTITAARHCRLYEMPNRRWPEYAIGTVVMFAASVSAAHATPSALSLDGSRYEGVLPNIIVWAGALSVLYAALHDFAARTVPNAVPATLAILGLILRLMSHSLLPGLAWAGGVFAVTVFCWLRGWLGAGDVKLLAAGALMIPPVLCATFIAAVALAGGALAIAYALLAFVACRLRPPFNIGGGQGRLRAPLWRRALTAERWRLRRGAPLPYAAAIAAGFLFTLFRS